MRLVVFKMNKYKLIQEELETLNKKGWSILDRFVWGITKRETIEYEISLPASTFLRLRVFCEDIEELSEMRYTIEDLINALYNDFLFFAQKTADIDKIYTQLSLHLDIMNKYLSPPNDDIDTNDDDIKQYERLIYKDHEVVSKKKKMHLSFISIKIGIQRAKALRGEVVLADMEEKYPDHPFTISNVLTIFIQDFINEVKSGNAKTLLERILKSL